jgi:hypothetical protein
VAHRGFGAIADGLFPLIVDRPYYDDPGQLEINNRIRNGGGYSLGDAYYAYGNKWKAGALDQLNDALRKYGLSVWRITERDALPA